MKRKVSILLAVLLVALSAAGCSSLTKPFLGKWSDDFGGELGVYYIFKGKGIMKATTSLGELSGKPELDFGTYEVIDEDTIQMTDILGEKKEYTYAFAEDGNKLTMSDEEYIMSFTKVLPEK
ncbi:MAG TPA: hypothetical protein PK854_02785 [Oscillospiraceae bacterium]|nr:hypothetical protein [Oscillospiraceae bacterium]HPS34170.1 hypothetical protein [Oscillospiraceae bacterium]